MARLLPLAKVLRSIASRIETEQRMRERISSEKDEFIKSEQALIDLLGIACIHGVIDHASRSPRRRSGTGYCCWVMVNGERTLCPLGRDELRKFCTRPRRWSK